MFKRLLAAMMALTLIVGMTVVSYAYASPPDVPTWYVKDGESYIGTLQTSALSSIKNAFELMEEFAESKQAALFYRPSSNVYIFVIFDGTPSSITWTGSTEITLKGTSSTASNIRYIYFNALTGARSYGPNIMGLSTSQGLPVGYLVRGWNSFPLSVPENLILDYEGGLGIVDDGGIFANTLPTPPDPEEPSSSTPPPTPSVPSVPFPEVKPSDSEWVVYDATKWNQFADQVKQSIGSSTNVGLLIFATILSLYLIHRIVRKFAD